MIGSNRELRTLHVWTQSGYRPHDSETLALRRGVVPFSFRERTRPIPNGVMKPVGLFLQESAANLVRTCIRLDDVWLASPRKRQYRWVDQRGLQRLEGVKLLLRGVIEVRIRILT